MPEDLHSGPAWPDRRGMICIKCGPRKEIQWNDDGELACVGCGVVVAHAKDERTPMFVQAIQQVFGYAKNLKELRRKAYREALEDANSWENDYSQQNVDDLHIIAGGLLSHFVTELAWKGYSYEEITRILEADKYVNHEMKPYSLDDVRNVMKSNTH